MRFASRENALLSQWEIGAALVPGGGPMARLPRLIGRGRALEVLLSGEDIPGDLAERYGYVNRALPDAELDRFVDALAHRIARFDKQSIADIKRLVDIPSLPPLSEIGAEWDAFLASAQRPQAQQNIKRLMDMCLVVRICHCGFPVLLLLRRQLGGDAVRFVNNAEHIKKIRKGVKHAAGVEIAKAEPPAVGAAGVKRKNRFQGRMVLQRCSPLLTGKT